MANPVRVGHPIWRRRTPLDLRRYDDQQSRLVRQMLYEFALALASWTLGEARIIQSATSTGRIVGFYCRRLGRSRLTEGKARHGRRGQHRPRFHALFKFFSRRLPFDLARLVPRQWESARVTNAIESVADGAATHRIRAGGDAPAPPGLLCPPRGAAAPPDDAGGALAGFAGPHAKPID
jgi:hypothetical protein